MLDPESKELWEELKGIWKKSSDTKKIQIQISELVDELKGKVGQFEMDSINKDIAMITGSITQFEKESISRDMAMFSGLIRRLLRRLGIRK